ncbi:MAG: Nucleotidyltransferase/DNA polymerase involved in repair-like protein [Verrucomicrobia bacterium]|nr:Nucleotidyltransferase/DNA polymerase involved in repair-like protein [Verrucomicrobiota bacterium]
MNFAVIWIPNFSLLAVQRSEPSLSGRPVALLAGEGRKAVVVEFSPEAANVTAGLAGPLASARCPGLQLRERDLAAEDEAQRLLVAAAFALSPRVESTAPGSCTVDLQGADPVNTEAAMQALVLTLHSLSLPARIGAGETPLLARYAARRAEPVLVIRSRAAFLSSLPLDFAAPMPAQAAILRGWGIATLGQLTALAKGQVGERLGPEGVQLWERANGDSPSVLCLAEPARSFFASWNYEPPVESIEPLMFKLRRYAERVAAELRGAGLVAEKLTLALTLEDETDFCRDYRLPEPGADVDSWLRVLQTHLDTVRLEERVASVRLVATPARPQARQDGLFDTGLTDPHSFWENLARLAALVGDDRVGTPVHVDSHAPDAFRLERPAVTVLPPEPDPVHPPRGGVLHRFCPAWPVQVFCTDQTPAAISGALQGEVCAKIGPHYFKGDWWKPGAWAVETWQVELTDGGVYQLSKIENAWWIEGTFD